MKKFMFYGVLMTLFFSCAKEPVPTAISNNEPIDVDAIIEEQLHRTNRVFEWENVGLDVLWSAIEQGDYIVTVGYGADNQFDLANSPELQSQKEQLLNTILEMESKVSEQNIELSDILLNESETLTYFDVFIRNKATLKYLKEQANTRYLEPGNYIFKKEERDNPNHKLLLDFGAGCGTDPQTINTHDYTVEAPAAWVPWNFYLHNIPQAWNESTGANIEVGVIDTGISPDQDNFSSDFNSGLSSGRSVGKDGTYVSSWLPWADPDGPDDQCGHGTSMAGIIAAPKNAENVPVGVAYNCDLFTVRGTADVLLDGYSEQDGVADAITLLAGRSKTKIISMSLGNIVSVSKIKDAVRYAVNKKGKLFFAAGGTSFDLTTWYGVIFPASMSETVAVTGVTDANNYEACDVCHSGSEIDFTIIMQRANDGSRKSVGIGFDNDWANYIGGSSVATATTAGIAALIWSKYPNLRRSKVLDKLKDASEFYPNRHSDFGYGNIDALEAIQ